MQSEEIYCENYFSDMEKIYQNQTFFIKDRFRNVTELIGEVKSNKLLDLGTANGMFAIECAKQGAFSIGLDFSKIALNNAKKFADKSVADVNFVCSDCSILPFKSDSFDMLLLIDLVEHLDKSLYEKTIIECYRVLKYGGRIVIYTPNKEHLIEYLRKCNIILSSFRGHTNLMNMGEVVKVLQQNNFSIEKSYHKCSHIPIFNKLESFLVCFPLIKKYFRRRICLLGRK